MALVSTKKSKLSKTTKTPTKTTTTTTTKTEAKMLTVKSLRELEQNFTRSKQLGIVDRAGTSYYDEKAADKFFAKLLKSPKFNGISGIVRKSKTLADVKLILSASNIPKHLTQDPFYDFWIKDIVSVCKTFCTLEKKPEIAMSIETERGCSRYHVDNVPQRLLVTYVGQGTEILPDEAADRQAFEKFKPNEKILKDPSVLFHMKRWNVTVFRGGRNGLLHRTPDSAIEKKNLLLRLDHSGFWDVSGAFVFVPETRTYRQLNEDDIELMYQEELAMNEKQKQKKKKKMVSTKKAPIKKTTKTAKSSKTNGKKATKKVAAKKAGKKMTLSKK